MIAIDPLSKNHDRSVFRSGQPELDAWFIHRSAEDEKRGAERTFVAIDKKLGVIGIYSLSYLTLSVHDLPKRFTATLRGHDAIPAALIGRRGRDERVQGGGVGELLLADALRRILGAARSMPIFAILADAQDDHAAEFYTDFGFRPFPSRKLRLFLAMAPVIAALAKGQAEPAFIRRHAF
jgi:GNAT superfamily N-acetyltransferase